MKTVKLLSSARGFTLMEMMIGMTTAALLAAGVYRTYRFFFKNNLTQQRIALGQNEIFPIQAVLEKNLRRASFGIPIVSHFRDSTGANVSRSALVPSDNGSNPDGLTIWGNFSEVRAQLRQPFPASALIMTLQSGTSTGFVVGDWVVLDMGEYSEYLKITTVDATRDELGGGPRAYSYPAGTSVIKVSSIEFRPDTSSLSMIGDRTSVLTRNLKDLRFYFNGYDGTVDSASPYNMNEVKSVAYWVRVRIAKAGNDGYLYRDATGEILLRNIPL